MDEIDEAFAEAEEAHIIREERIAIMMYDGGLSERKAQIAVDKDLAKDLTKLWSNLDVK
jgi:hypothetical protein